MNLLAEESSEFNVRIKVFETTRLYGELGKFRCLQFSDDAVQGAIDLKNPKRIVLEYQKAMIQLMTLINPEFNRAFVIGHGIGTIAAYYSDKKIKVAEIDAKVVELSRRLFDYRLDNVVVGDGRDVLNDERSDFYDYLVVDAFTPMGTPLRLTALTFFQMTSEKLNSSGTLFMNVFGKPNKDRLINAIYSTLREIYPYTKAYSLPAKDDSEVRNMILLASKKPIVLPGKNKAGLSEIELEEGHLILDNDRGIPDRK
ncbi:spermidine synthase [Cohnella cholangitidis]|uniref:spermidine synthase n=1 Tax=Cohnella cholangitidis TaxID=2598458 RepID=UPI001E54DA37|nr:fused MFS/spermidine synthase [Cohnella cholangitidis]